MTDSRNELAGRVAVITGAARGIGRAVAETYIANGATVVLSDVTAEAAQATSDEIGGAGGVACDVTDEAQVQALFAGVAAEHGTVDVAVANAGISHVSPIAELSFEDWRRMMSINLDGVFLTVREATRTMAGTGTAGSIITMASITGFTGVPLTGHYAAAKAAVISLTKTTAVEMRPAGIRVNAICPGFAHTELVSSAKATFEEKAGLESFDAVMDQLQGGYVQLEDIAYLAEFLASDRSAFCTGGAYAVDGGLTASLL